MKPWRIFLFRLLLATLLLATLGGCFGGARSIAPDYYLLTGRALPATPPPAAASFSIGVGPVRVAPFLARQQIVTHAGGSVLNLLPQRWGEPLEQGIQRTILQNLTTLTGAQTRGFPWRQSTQPDYAVRIDVIDLDRYDDSTALLDVNWVLEDLKNHRIVITQQVRLNSAINGTGAAALTEAYNDLLAQLAQRMAQALNTTKT